MKYNKIWNGQNLKFIFSIIKKLCSKLITFLAKVTFQIIKKMRCFSDRSTAEVTQIPPQESCWWTWPGGEKATPECCSIAPSTTGPPPRWDLNFFLVSYSFMTYYAGLNYLLSFCTFWMLMHLFIRPQPVSPERSVLCQGRITPWPNVSHFCFPIVRFSPNLASGFVYHPIRRIRSHFGPSPRPPQSFVESGSKIEKCE